MAFTVYILQCADETLYVGHTDDLDRRLSQHDGGRADSYTAARLPVRLIHAEEFESRYEAITVERKLKGWSRAKKLAYIGSDWGKVASLSKGEHQWQRKSLDASTPRPPAATLSANGKRKGERNV